MSDLGGIKNIPVYNEIKKKYNPLFLLFCLHLSMSSTPPQNGGGYKHGMFIQYLISDAWQMGANANKEQTRRDHVLRQVPGIGPSCDAGQTLEVLEQCC